MSETASPVASPVEAPPAPQESNSTRQATTAAPDPVAAPGDFLHELRDSYRSAQWALLLVLGLYGLARLGQWVADTWKVAWLGGWKLRALVAVVSVFGALLASLGDDGSVDWRAVVGAVAATVVLYLRPDPVEPPSSSESPPAAGSVAPTPEV